VIRIPRRSAGEAADVLEVLERLACVVAVRPDQSTRLFELADERTEDLARVGLVQEAPPGDSSTDLTLRSGPRQDCRMQTRLLAPGLVFTDDTLTASVEASATFDSAIPDLIVDGNTVTLGVRGGGAGGPNGGSSGGSIGSQGTLESASRSL
jgi:hypothetical protein